MPNLPGRRIGQVFIPTRVCEAICDVIPAKDVNSARLNVATTHGGLCDSNNDIGEGLRSSYEVVDSGRGEVHVAQWPVDCGAHLVPILPHWCHFEQQHP